jgi:hypothetical protein
VTPEEKAEAYEHLREGVTRAIARAERQLILESLIRHLREEMQ